MRFDPLTTAKNIEESFRSYTAKTFFIKDDELQEAFQEQLDSFPLANGPFIESPNSFKQGKSLKGLIEEGLLSSEFNDMMKGQETILTRPLYAHQEKAIRLIEAGRNAIVTTGTGSGKTECFLYPILDSLMKEKEKGTLGPGVRVLLLYPMNALVSDQMDRLRNILKDYPHITFGSYNGETETATSVALNKYKTLHNGKEPAKNELISRDQMIATPPNLLVTNYSMLEYLMLRPRDNVFFHGDFSKSWKYIVLDEAHTYSGATGMEVSMLLRRLYHTLENKENVQFILTSATLGDENSDNEICDFARRLCAGVAFDPSDIVRADRVVIDIPEDTVSASDDEIKTLVDYLELYIDSEDKPDEEDKKYDLAYLLTNTYGCPFDDDIKKLMFDSIRKEKLYSYIRKSLDNGAEKVEELATSVGRTPETVTNVIRLANYAQDGGTKLLDSRYHFFVRTLEGAFVTILPQKTISLTPRKKATFDGEEWNCYRLSVCQFCGAIYLQPIEEEKKNNIFYMLVEDNVFDSLSDEERTKLKVLNCKTNKIKDYNHGMPLESCELLTLQCSPKEEDSYEIKRCAACDTRSTNGGILRSFYLGQDASCSVVFRSLYEDLPTKRIKIEFPNTGFAQHRFQYKDTKSILSFADSRQDAAYFASYFQYTYDVIINRRYLLSAIRESCDKDLKSIQSTLASILEEQGVEQAKKESLLIILSEMKEFTRNSLRNSGWIEFEFKKFPLDDFDGSDFLIKDSRHPDLKMKKEELWDILSFFVKQILRHGALSHGYKLCKEELERFSYSGKQPVVMLEDIGERKDNLDIKYLIPSSGRNTFAHFLGKIGIKPDKIRDFISNVFDTLKYHEILIPYKTGANKYLINLEKVEVLYIKRDNYKLWKCDKCGRVTNLNIQGKCGTYNCDGSLIPFDFENEANTNYFSNQYDESKKPAKFVIKEHTAQLSKDSASQYQQDFIKGKIQALSCSTTFEMGVDVGDLNAVFMKNMPPKPSNYVQRAGRAGRRTDSDAFILTFCRLSSHDFFFFNRPKEMIEGKITPPLFKIDNKKIVERHVYSAIASWYWKKLPDVKKAIDFFTDERFPIVLDYINKAKEDNDFKVFINSILPTEELKEQYSVFFGEYVEKLTKAREEFNGNIDEIKAKKEEYKNLLDSASSTEENEIYKRSILLNKMLQTIEDTAVIDYYSRNNLIPKYGFPVDTVHLATDHNSTRFNSISGLDLQRDSQKAISEYAPGAEVIADGKIYRSRYILKPFSRNNDKTWQEEIIALCPTCFSATRVSSYYDDGKMEEIKCGNCGNLIKGSHVIFPMDGFAVDMTDPEDAKTKKPVRETHSEYFYLGREGITSNKKTVEFGEHSFEMETTSDDEMYVQNNMDFFVCEECGYAFTSKEFKSGKDFKHKKMSGVDCKGHFIDNNRHPIKLGHSFKTDVTKLTFNVRLSQPQAMTVMYALIEGFCSKFGIERDDINGLVTLPRSQGASKVMFYIFDSTPGGSGNSKKLYFASNDELRDVFKAAYDLVSDCTCGKDGDSVCYSCLCNYNNQKWHDVMKRKYAISFFSWLLGNDKKLIMED